MDIINNLSIANIFDTGIKMYPLTTEVALALGVTFVLILVSAFISGSEVAFFSLSPSKIVKLQNSKSSSGKRAISLLENPEKLLAAILIANNFVNVGIVILSSFIITSTLNFGDDALTVFLFQVFMVTFVLLLFGEIIPKVYASEYDLKFSRFMAIPLYYISKISQPLIYILLNSTNFVNRRINVKTQSISIQDISKALEITSVEQTEEEEILKGIVNFGNKNVVSVMRPRIDVTYLDIALLFDEVVEIAMESGYSRIPVCDSTFDNIKGVLYIKDLLPYLDKKSNFRWQTLIRPPYFVPETKKINALLEEFQKRKMHMAVVIDEYGGSSGIITLEDILEEIVGEISDEYDDEELLYLKRSDGSFDFEGKVLLNDFHKITNSNETDFDDIKGDADTLAGLILEFRGEIPEKGDTIRYKDHEFKIVAVDNRRIKKITYRKLRKYEE